MYNGSMQTVTSLKMKIYASPLLRIGMALVFLWFGFEQLFNTSAWVRLIPEWVTGLTGLTASTLVQFNGAFEVVFGTCLLFGFFTRVVSFLLALHMIHITFTLVMASGWNAISVRDFGLSVATITLFLLGNHSFSVDNWLCTRYEQKSMKM